MTPKPVSIAILIRSAVQRTSPRWQLLAMLAVLYGIVSGVINVPAFEILQEFATSSNATAGQATNAAPVDYSRELEILNDGMPTLIWVYLATTALSAALLVPWARAIAPGDLLPGSGNGKAHALRFLRAFSHYITATLLTAAAIVLGGFVITMVASLLGFMAMPLVFAGGLAFIWVTIILNAVANYALFYEAQDKPISFADTWRKFRPAFIPLSACLAAFYMVSIIAGLVFSGLFGPTGLNSQIAGMALNGAFSFSVGALHVAALAHYSSWK